LLANLILHGTASERERPRSRRRLRPQKLAEYWRKTEGTFDCQASLVFGRRRTTEGRKGTDVGPARRVHPGEAATEQKQGEVDGKRSAIGFSDLISSLCTAFLALVIIRSSAHERLMLYCPPTMYRWFVSSEVGHGVVNSGYYVPRSGVGSSARGLKPEGSSVAASSLDLRT
jgi:hypothetical protein